MIAKLGSEEGYIGNGIYNPFGVGALLAYPFENVAIAEGFANLL